MIKNVNIIEEAQILHYVLNVKRIQKKNRNNKKMILIQIINYKTYIHNQLVLTILACKKVCRQV